MFLNQFFGKLTWPTIAAIAGLHLLAVFVRDTSLALPALILIGAVLLYISIKSLPHGLLIAFSEVFVGGHGHLIDANIFGFSVSIRMVLFGVVMLAWLFALLKRDVKLTFVPNRDVPWILILLAVGIGAIVGFTSNDPALAFDDMNGYLAIGYLLPVISIKWNQTLKHHLLQVLAASVLWLGIFTVGLSFAFNHLDGDTLNSIYTFIRDARLAEVTLQTRELSAGEPLYWYRVFMQSHFFVGTLFLLFFSALLYLWKTKQIPWAVSGSFVLIFATFIISLSRSFTLGLIVSGFLVTVVAIFHQKKQGIPRIAKRGAQLGILFIVGCLFAGLSALIPPKPTITDAAFYSTSGDIDRGTAISSRWQLLPEMNKEILSSPVIGSGFGEEVTFITDDPRIRAIDPEGKYTTYRFEWGWHDVWLKTGALGLVAFMLYGWTLFKATLATLKQKEHTWLTIGLFAGVVMLFVAHIFTPFLNHPIGLIAMLLPIPFLIWKKDDGQEHVASISKPSAVRTAGMTPAMRVDEGLAE